jgi:hypothetical protein
VRISDARFVGWGLLTEGLWSSTVFARAIVASMLTRALPQPGGFDQFSSIVVS